MIAGEPTRTAEPLAINRMDNCQRCGQCCTRPCGMVPEDLPALLARFDVSFAEFFRGYLVAWLIRPPTWPILLVEMIPAQVDASGRRQPFLLTNNSTYRPDGHCIFFDRVTGCLVHDIKPLGGRIYRCHTMTGSMTIFMNNRMRAPYWQANQHLVEMLFPGYEAARQRINDVYRGLHRFWTRGQDDGPPRIREGCEQQAGQICCEAEALIDQTLRPLFAHGPRAEPASSRDRG